MLLLLLLLSRFSRVWLCVTLWTAAYQAPLSMGFSSQEYWSGLPLPSPVHHIGCLNYPHFLWPIFKQQCLLLSSHWTIARPHSLKLDRDTTCVKGLLSLLVSLRWIISVDKITIREDVHSSQVLNHWYCWRMLHTSDKAVAICSTLSFCSCTERNIWVLWLI